MTTLRDVSITPPRSLVEAKEATIIVSKKRPVVVYFEKAMELVTSKILAPLPPGKTYPDIEIRLVGAGGAIPRCQQVARYVVQEVRKKFKHLIKTVEKRLEATKNAVSVIDISLPADTPMEDAYLDAETSERFVNTCTVTIVVRI